MAWVGRDLKDHQVPNPCHRQGCFPLNQALGQVAQGPIQTGLEHLQEWDIHNFAGQPVGMIPYIFRNGRVLDDECKCCRRKESEEGRVVHKLAKLMQKEGLELDGL